MADLTGVPFRLSRAGSQLGVDAQSPQGVGLEMKRYEAGTDLDTSKIVFGLEQAARTKRDLQVWGLVTTQEVKAQLRDELDIAAIEHGVALLILDRTAGYPLPVPAIVALAALAPERLLGALEDPEWLDPKKDTPTVIEDVRQALEEIRHLDSFDGWSARIKGIVRGLPTWDRVCRRQNRLLKRRILEDAYDYFGTSFDRAAAVPREVGAQIADWFGKARSLAEPPVAVVCGERYDGKTWCVYEWLVENLDELTLPVFLFGAKEADGQDRFLREMVALEVAEHFEGDLERSRKLLARFSQLGVGAGPWGLVVLDGLNEYRVDPDRPFRHLADAAARQTNLDHRSCAALVTARTAWWREQGAKVKQSTASIEVGPYTDAELQVALTKCGEDLHLLATVQESARDLIRRPRYLQLVLDHRERLDDFGAITADVLHYLDAFDQMRSRGYLASTRWDHQAYSEALRGFARMFLEASRLGALWSRSDINAIVAGLSGDPQAALRDLESEGVVALLEGGYQISPDRLVTGMGLWLPKALKSARAKGDDLRGTLRDLLEPMKETDEKVAWLKAAVVFELLHSGAAAGDGAQEILDVLLDQWLRSRNIEKSDIQDAEAIGAQLLPSLIRLAPRTWSENQGDPRLQEISLLVFRDAALQPEGHRDRTLLLEAARAWCRFVPKAGNRFLKADDPEAEIQKRLKDPRVKQLGLERADDRGALKLQRTALYLESLSPGLLDAGSVLAVVAIEQIARNPLDQAELRLVRRMLENVPRAWFASQVAGRDEGSALWLSICQGLVRAAKRADLEALKDATAPPPDPERERLFRELHPTIEDHLLRAQTRPAEDEDVLRFAEMSRRLVLDPANPIPTQERLNAIAVHVRQEFEGVRLQAGREMTSEDHRIRGLTPALAAWLPEVGVEVVESQIKDLPRRFSGEGADDGATLYTWRLARHSVLLKGPLRKRLHSVLATAYPDEQRQFDAALVLVALMPGMSARQRLGAILGHSLRLKGKPFEWRKIYDLASFLAEQSFIEALSSQLETEEEPLRLQRLRLLVVEIGGVAISEGQAKRIERDLTADDDGIQYAAVAAAASGKITTLPADPLLQLVSTEDDHGSRAPRYAAWLIVQKGERLDDLSIYWQAVAAARYPERRRLFLNEVERALFGSLGADDKTEDSLENILIKASLDDPLAHQVGVSAEAADSTVVFYTEDPGIGGLESPEEAEGKADLFRDPRELVEKKNRLAREAAKRFKDQAENHERVWESEVFPRQLVDSLEPERFTTWANLLLSGSEKAEFLWTGLLQSMFRRALREGSDLADGLLKLCFPFSRRGSFPVVRFLMNGLHWTLHHLVDSESDDRKACELLETLILDCRNDLELFEVTLAARLGESHRLEGLVKSWLTDTDSETRGRAVRLAGWLTTFHDRLEAIHRDDPSLHVRELARIAIETENQEKWARRWFRVFVSNGSVAQRWGAGQLFIECADRRLDCWVKQELSLVTGTRTRGEAFLLLEAARREIESREKKLKDTFLGVKVSDLEYLCHPWRPGGTWRRLEPRPKSSA